MEAEDPLMRERLIGLKLQRDQISKEIEELQNRMASATPLITREKVVRVGKLLRDKLYEGSAEFRQAYARLIMDEIRITDDEIRIAGPNSVLAKCAEQGVGETVPKVLSFVREWRAARDSNFHGANSPSEISLRKSESVLYSPQSLDRRASVAETAAAISLVRLSEAQPDEGCIRGKPASFKWLVPRPDRARNRIEFRSQKSSLIFHQLIGI